MLTPLFSLAYALSLSSISVHTLHLSNHSFTCVLIHEFYLACSLSLALNLPSILSLSRSLTLSLALSHPHLFTFSLIHPFLCTCTLVLLCTPSLTRCPSSLFLICPLSPSLSYSFTPFFARAISLFHSFILLLVCSLLPLSFSCSKQVL
jgi:hypothetical protein